MKYNKILVTGGAGFIGSTVVDTLVEKYKCTIVVVDNLSTGKKKYVNNKTRFYQCDIKDQIALGEVFSEEHPDLVIHMAAQVMLRDSIVYPGYDASTNILGTINVLEMCRKHNVKKIIYTSTGGARYGFPERLPVKETDLVKPTSPYGISKSTAEHYIRVYNELYGIDYLILCFGNVYGPRDNPATKRVTAIFSDKMLKNERVQIYGDGDQTRDFIYVKDLAGFIVSIIDKSPEHKLFNIANGKQISVNAIFDILADIACVVKDPEYKDAIKGEIRDIVLDTTLAEKELGWKQTTSIVEGLKETYYWFRNNVNN